MRPHDPDALDRVLREIVLTLREGRADALLIEPLAASDVLEDAVNRPALSGIRLIQLLGTQAGQDVPKVLPAPIQHLEGALDVHAAERLPVGLKERFDHVSLAGIK